MDRFFRARGILPESLSPLDRLAWLGDRGMGALEYKPANIDASAPGAAMDLGSIAAQAERIVAGSAEEALPALRAGGGSSGGSRPKVFIAYNPVTGQVSSDILRPGPGFEPWLVKFRAREDPEDAGSIEAAYAEMAREAGIEFPPSRLFETSAGRFFGVQRFDRGPGGLRIHVHTFGGMVHSHFRHPNRDYQEFLDVVFSATKDFRQVEQAFRRAAFNVLAHNRDDHVKNHAFIADRAGRWRLSPAYDLTLSGGISGQHNMTVAGSGNPGVPELLALAKAAGIRPRDASAMITSVSAAVVRWPEFAETAQVSPSSTAMAAALLTTSV
jgi:serine/threonine-protein kinase HipA